MQFRRKYQRRSYIDITPMIDIIFNLLLFFIVLAFLQNRQGIKINLPTADTASKEAVSETSQISINAGLEFFINGKKTNKLNLLDALKNSVVRSPDKTLFISADGAVPHAIVVRVMDLAKQVGFIKLSIAAKKNNTHQ